MADKSETIRTEALIHDLAIVLGGCLHPSAMIGPAPRLAANRLRDVLGITPGELTAGIEDRIVALLGAGTASESQQFQIREAREALARWDASQDAPGIYSTEGTLAAHLRNVLEIIALLGAGTGQEG